MLVCFFTDAVDDAGHKTWWGSDVYYEIVKQKDAQLAGILNALAETTTKSGESLRLLSQNVLL